MKKLGFGLMRLPLVNPDDQTSIDIEQFKAMADRFIERGFTYLTLPIPITAARARRHCVRPSSSVTLVRLLP